MSGITGEQSKARHGDPASAFESHTFDQDISIRVNEAVGSASISPSGRDVVLASRQGLHIIDLDSPWSLPRHLPHTTPWEVADVQWSPFAARNYWIVSTSNQKALVWNLELQTSRAPIEHILHAHSRAITDINFSAHHPEMLATCAVDSFVHCWDLRHPARPAMTFCDWFAGATQVKWNRQDSHILASSHDRYLRIWDERKGAYPLRSIEAHATKIYGVDWNRTRPTGVATCSLDKTIKFWDYETEEDVPERVIRTPFPVWRARHTPFGWGLLAMPQRGNHDLHLYDRRLSGEMSRDAAPDAVHSFCGHLNQVKEFLWRSRGGIEDGVDNRDFQLVSWGTDRELRLHKIQPEHLRAVGYEKGKAARKQFNLTRQGASYRTFREPNTPPRLTENGRGVKPSDHPGGVAPNVRSAHALPGAGFLTTPSGMQGRNVAKKGMSLITWMKGVKVGKREGGSAYLRQSSRLSVRSSESRASTAWEVPESLGDEITHVGDKFKKVNFEGVDVNARCATVSLNGPWGANGRQVYVKMTITFPSGYPDTAEPAFALEKTSSFDDESLERISNDIHAIAEAHTARHVGCLEAVLAYLLGERGLEESILSLHDDEFPSLKGEESSSDEEDGVGLDFAGTQTQSLDLGAADMIGSASANANVPAIPKACGASWAHDGRLVCFFPTKEETKSLLSTVTLRDNDRSSKTPKVFEGFGRLYTDSPEAKKKRSSTPALYPSDSEGSYTCSSSSDSEEDIGILPDRFPPPIAWRGAYARFQRSRSAERSQQSGSVSATNKAGPPKPKSIVSMHGLHDLLPSKRELAEGYVMFGDGPSVCKHNAGVAAKHGYADLSDIWRLVGLILMNDLPLEVMPQPHRREEILVLARRALVRIKRRDSGLDLAFDEAEAVANPKLKSRVKWGGHPFASLWLIDALFEHFEQAADVQMLGMLSCIFHEPAAREGPSTAAMHLSNRDVPLAMKCPAFSLDYFASQEVAWSLFQPTVSILPTPQMSHTPIGTYGSAGSSNGPWSNDQTHNDPGSSYSTGTTPPKLSRSNTSRSAVVQSLSTSPEHSQRSMRSSNVNLANAISASLSRPFYNILSSSPPSQGRAPGNDFDLSTSAPQNGGITWGSNTIYEGAATSGTNTPRFPYQSAASSFFHGGADPPKHSQSHYTNDSDYDAKDGGGNAVDAASSPYSDIEPDVKVALKNQDRFDMEGCVSFPLLDPRPGRNPGAYRKAYADLLFAWKLWFQRCEVASFDGLVSYWTDHQSGELADGESWKGSGSVFSKAERLHEDYEYSEEETEGLEIAVCCSLCGRSTRKQSRRAAGAKGTRRMCEHCHRPGKKVLCSICWSPVAGLYKACADCGHISHATCATQWFESDDSGKNEVCEAGCGCDCNKQAFHVSNPAAFEFDDDDRLTISSVREKAKSSVRRTREQFQRDLSRRSDAGLSRSLRQALVATGKGVKKDM